MKRTKIKKNDTQHIISKGSENKSSSEDSVDELIDTDNEEDSTDDDSNSDDENSTDDERIIINVPKDSKLRAIQSEQRIKERRENKRRRKTKKDENKSEEQRINKIRKKQILNKNPRQTTQLLHKHILM